MKYSCSLCRRKRTNSNTPPKDWFELYNNWYCDKHEIVSWDEAVSQKKDLSGEFLEKFGPKKELDQQELRAKLTIHEGGLSTSKKAFQ